MTSSVLQDRQPPDPAELTRLLHAHRSGDQDAFEQLIEIVYPQLRRLARSQLARQSSETNLDVTSLVNEAYIRLVQETGVEWTSRGHFYAVSALTMRRILVDQARRRTAEKRGSGQRPVTLDADHLSMQSEAELVLAVDEALCELEAFNERLARVVECRYFAGLTGTETAAALEISTRTVERDWLRARSWLADKLQQTA
ncbi:MAG: ECF-type sigma factor [Thermoanaerobaculia bacterium]|nr:ECF-type sigma factor [Thermoanaerobaculia bacterium]